MQSVVIITQLKLIHWPWMSFSSFLAVIGAFFAPSLPKRGKLGTKSKYEKLRTIFSMPQNKNLFPVHLHDIKRRTFVSFLLLSSGLRSVWQQSYIAAIFAAELSKNQEWEWMKVWLCIVCVRNSILFGRPVGRLSTEELSAPQTTQRNGF